MDKKNNVTSSYIKFGIVLLFMFGFRFLPPFGSMTPYGMAVLGILIGAILGWTFDSQTMLHTSLLAVVALATAGYPGGIDALCNGLLAQSSLVLMILSMIISGALTDAGVDNYLIGKVMTLKFAQGKPWVLTAILVVGPFVLSLFIVSMALVVFLLPLYAKLLKEAGYKAGDKYVVHVMAGMVLSANVSTYLLPFKGMPLAFQGMAKAYTGLTWTYPQWMMSISIYAVILSVGYVLFMRLIGCDASKIASVDFNAAFNSNAEINNYQKSVLYCVFLFLIGAIVVSFGGLMDNALGHMFSKISVYGWIMLVLVIMMLVRVDGKRLLNLPVATAKGFSWDIIMLVASATLVGSALTSADAGFGATLTATIAPLLQGLGPVAILIALFTFALIATNLCNNMAILMIGYTLTAGLVAAGIPINGPLATAGLLLFAMLGFLLPSSSAFGAMLHTADMLTPASIYKHVTLMLVYIIVTGAAILVPLGLMAF